MLKMTVTFADGFTLKPDQILKALRNKLHNMSNPVLSSDKKVLARIFMMPGVC